ncbi:MAG: mechanosensitive ion channel family protein [Myxococcota bacterium]
MKDWLAAFELEELGKLAGTGVLLGAALLLVARILLPREERSKLRGPFLFYLLHGACLTIDAFLPRDSIFVQPVELLALFFVLISIGRTGFLVLAHSILSRRLARPLPKIFRDIVQATIYAIALLITLRAAGVEPGSLLTTSALLTAVIGLSLQDTLGNLFAGLAIQAQEPFRIGDWIQFDDEPKNAGEVVEINWRAVRLRTIERIEVTVPNNALARAPIRNFSRPDPESRREIHCTAPYDVSPRHVMGLLCEAIEDVPGVLREPTPSVVPNDFDERGVSYTVRYYIKDFERRDYIDGHVRERIWYALSRAEIDIPVPQRWVHLHEPTAAEAEERDRRRIETRAKHLRGVDFLDSLPEEAITVLARMSETRLYDANEAIIRQGDEDEEFFIVLRGRVSIEVRKARRNRTQAVATLGPGQFFGEMSLMTGERRRATVRSVDECQLLVIGKQAFHRIFDDRPELIAKISRVLAAREEELGELTEEGMEKTKPDERSAELLTRIRDFFSI